MERITTPSRQIDKWGLGKDGFTDGNQAAGQMSTQLNGDWFDQLQEEVANQIELELGPLDPANMFQLNESITAQIGRAIATAGGNFVLRAGDTMTGPLSVAASISLGAFQRIVPDRTYLANGTEFYSEEIPLARRLAFGIGSYWQWNALDASLDWNTPTSSPALRILPSGAVVASSSVGVRDTAPGSNAFLYLATDGATRGLSFQGPDFQLAFNIGNQSLGYTAPGPITYFTINAIGNVLFHTAAPSLALPGIFDLTNFDTCINATGTWSGPSDRRIKQDIVPYETGLDAIRRLQPQSFSFTPETGLVARSRHIGIIGQDIEEVMPETISRARVGPNLERRMGNVELDDLLQFNAAPITYALVNAVKELAERLEALEGKLSQGAIAARGPQGRTPR